MNAPLRLGISSCLLGNKVRYNGSHKEDSFLMDTFGKYVEYVPVCPEVECGMGVPRETLHLTGSLDSPSLMTTQTRKNYTEQMTLWANRRITELKLVNLCGFIFKKDSPSCGLKRVKVYNEKGVFVKKGIGAFARVFMLHFPLLPVEDEARLHAPMVREDFIRRILIQHTRF